MAMTSSGIASGGFALKGLHHYAYKCQDPVKTRHFYEKVLGLRLAHTVRATATPTTGGDPTHYFHLFFEMKDGSYIAFFDLGDDEKSLPSPNTAAWVNHIAFEVADKAELLAAKAALEGEGIEVVGPLNHDFIESIYFFDPNGIRMEFTIRIPEVEQQGSHVYGAAGTPEEEFDKWVVERSRAREFAQSWASAERK